MGWSFRKAVRLGPFRLNLSKRGVGVSTGVPGLRVGVDSSGRTYASGGRGGFYFREYLGKLRTPKTHQGAWTNRPPALRVVVIIAAIAFAALVVLLLR